MFLFCTHELILTGAPLFLVELVETLASEFNITVYSPEGGPLKQRLEAVGVPVVHELRVKGPVVANTLLMHKTVEEAHDSGHKSLWIVHESNPHTLGLPGNVAGMMCWPHKTIFGSHATASLYRAFCDPEVIHTIVRPFEPLDRQLCRKELGWGDEFVVLNVGTIEKRKGQSDLIEAVKGLDVRCVLVGRNLDGVEAEVVEPTDEYRKYLAAADLFVMCSRVECFPRVTQEASIQGLPIITTPAFGLREQVHDGVHGMHYMAGNVQELRKKIEMLKEDEELRRSLVRPLCHLIDFQTMVDRYRELLRELLP